MADETRLMTYAELAVALGITRGSAKNLVREKRWHRVPSNQGREVRAHVPLSALPDGPPPQASPEGEAPRQPAWDGPSRRAFDFLTEHIAKLQAEAETLRALPAQVAALEAARDAARESETRAREGECRAREDAARLREENSQLLTREHLRDQRRWWRRLAG